MHRGQDRVGEGTRPGDKPKAPAGNGRAVAMLAACEGASVACADVSPSAAAATAALFGEEGARRLPVIGDATDPGQSSAMFAEALRELGALHAVVVNVGIGLGAGLTDTSPQRWERELSLNLSAPFLAAQYGYGLPRPSSSIPWPGCASSTSSTWWRTWTGSAGISWTSSWPAWHRRAVRCSPRRRRTTSDSARR
ncbi:SDR family oxidoreductase [Streptomyces mirabilis]|uniref:SDR family oxidoreductase n=1 Tax=Streptomyces mirabilis TaxID=68239 RepID=UPI0031BB75EC